MFKSIFAKYVTAFMVIITLGFTLLLLIVTSVVGNYSAESKAKLMENTADVTKIFLEDQVKNSLPEQFSQVIQTEEEDSIHVVLKSFVEYDSNLAVLVADANGTILYSVGQEDLVSSAESTSLPTEISDAIAEDPAFSEILTAEFCGERLWVRAVGVYNASGDLCGIIAACSTAIRWGDAMEGLTKTVISSAFLVLLAALIAAYFITERTIAPLHDMRNAARDFAAGKFERRLNVRGKDEVAELAEAFNQMAESLENLEKMRNSFVANVSHDLRTPMTTISGFIDGILDGVIPLEERDHYLEIVSKEVHRLSRLVASLLDLSRIQAGDRKFLMKSFDICEMARVILISFEQQIEEKHLEVEFACEEDRMFVLADHDAIYQIFYNICHNALKFSRNGGTLRIRVQSTKEKKVLVSVYNDGQGIPSDDLTQVFDRFYKSDKSRGLDKSGLGLGLYISKTIITAHGEKIWVESEEGKNCEFFFTLTRSPHPPIAPENKLGGGTIN
ncbi:MAG: HAMP domain-containing protein [Clostridia bacterium]|nr:HAMP domain-containing protein [Clostridia bacterium]